MSDLLDRAINAIVRGGATVDDAARPGIADEEHHRLFMLVLRAATASRMRDEDFARQQEIATTLADDDFSDRAAVARGATLLHRYCALMEVVTAVYPEEVVPDPVALPRVRRLDSLTEFLVHLEDTDAVPLHDKRGRLKFSVSKFNLSHKRLRANDAEMRQGLRDTLDYLENNPIEPSTGRFLELLFSRPEQRPIRRGERCAVSSNRSLSIASSSRGATALSPARPKRLFGSVGGRPAPVRWRGSGRLQKRSVEHASHRRGPTSDSAILSELARCYCLRTARAQAACQGVDRQLTKTTGLHRTMAKVCKSDGQETFAGTQGNGEVAPIADVA